MSEEVLAAVAQMAVAGAAVLVTAMASSVWRWLRERVADLLGRGDRSREELLWRLLQESRRRVGATAVSDRAAAGAWERRRWEMLLRRTLAADPGLALELAVLLEELAAYLPAPGTAAYTGQLAEVSDDGSVDRVDRVDRPVVGPADRGATGGLP